MQARFPFESAINTEARRAAYTCSLGGACRAGRTLYLLALFMEILLLVAVLAVAAFVLKNREQQRRIALLGEALGKYQIEQLMQNLIDGYMRWLSEDDVERKAQIWGVLEGTEQALAGQFSNFAREFQKVDAPLAQISKLPLAIPFAQQLLPGWRLFDARKAFAIHARAIEDNAQNVLGLNLKAKAFMMTAELFLMQHTCHWFCRSKTVASARLMARHQSSYEQALAAVSPQTRAAYRELTGV